MYYGYTTLATGWSEKDMNDWKVRVIKAILFFIPRANLDNEKLYPKVEKWLLELDDEGVPQREIGVGENDTPLFSAPNDRNFGLWTDSNNTLSKEEVDLIDKAAFEEMWLKINPTDE